MNFIKSESIINISKAIALFNIKVDKIPKDSENPFYKNSYASLSTIIEHTKVALCECNLVLSQFPDDAGLTSILIHTESGEFLQAWCLMPVAKQNDPQAFGSAITYFRRYAYGAILGLNIDKDDDANNAAKVEPAKEEPAKPWLTQVQFDAMLKSISEGKKEEVKKAMGKYLIKKDYKTQLEEKLK
jgi:hypothetical protein